MLDHDWLQTGCDCQNILLIHIQYWTECRWLQKQPISSQIFQLAHQTSGSTSATHSCTGLNQLLCMFLLHMWRIYTLVLRLSVMILVWDSLRVVLPPERVKWQETNNVSITHVGGWERKRGSSQRKKGVTKSVRNCDVTPPLGIKKKRKNVWWEKSPELFNWRLDYWVSGLQKQVDISSLWCNQLN